MFAATLPLPGSSLESGGWQEIARKIRLSKKLSVKIRETKDFDFGRLVLRTVGLSDDHGCGLWMKRADVTNMKNNSCKEIIQLFASGMRKVGIRLLIPAISPFPQAAAR
jgi:hypothetical protein